MGLRSFVALPVEKGGAVIRVVGVHNTDLESDNLTVNLAYGMGPQHTLLFGLPYRLSPSGGDRVGDVSVLHRYIIRQNDRPEGTHRVGLLGGAIIPTDADRDGALQAGIVATVYRDRHEWDADLLYRTGLDDRFDSGLYDLSWQFRLTPVEYPDWGIDSAWNSVIELGGRWTEGANMIHQITLGLQWIQRRWVLEGGVVKEINENHQTQYLISLRTHF